jgi:general stress protein 26
MAEFSNTSTGSKPADPYKTANLDNDIPLKDKVEGLTSFITNTKFGMMTTRDASSGNMVSRCMALTATVGCLLPIKANRKRTDVAAQESQGIDLLFYSNTESGKTNELASDPHVNISFINSSGEWASISGVSSIITDRSLVKKHYNSSLKAWMGDLGDGKHDGSENDPRIGVIRVKTITATYSITSKNIVSRTVEIAQGSVTGSPPQINKLREISTSEVEKWRSVAT